MRGQRGHGNLRIQPSGPIITFRSSAINHTDLNYAVRVSARARRVRLTIKPYHGLEVVIPKRFPRKQIPRILQQHEDWITTQLARHRSSFEPIRLPDRINLPLLEASYAIEYAAIGHSSDSRFQLREQPGRLVITHDAERQVITGLRRWIRGKAKQHLPVMLGELANTLGFKFTRCSIRSQKTRWGSCSGSGTISLNDQLLFLAPECVEYLMLHELCHTRVMNHSAQFWQLVARHQPEYRLMEQRLNRGREHIPGWFRQSLYLKAGN